MIRLISSSVLKPSRRPSLLLKNGCCSSTAKIPEILKLKPELKTHQDLHKFSVEQPDVFWGTLAKSSLKWTKEFDATMNCNMAEGKFSWFTNGQLNASVNCIDRHVDANPDKVALIWEKDEPGHEERVTYRQLSELVNKLANLFRSKGLGKGDIIAIYMPVTPMAVATMLACSRIGAIHSVVFAGFSSQALASRIQDMSAKAVVTANEGLRGGKPIPLRKTVSDALKGNQCPSVQNIFVMSRTDNNAANEPGDIILEEALKSMPIKSDPEPVDSDHYLFVLYTSGSTGSPKGIAHSTAGYLLYAGFSHKHVFSYYNNDDVFGCVADIGWITGHTYVVYGPLMNGGTTVLFEGTPNYPDPGRYWETVQRLKINQFYGSPTAIRLLLRHDDSYVKKYDRSSLKTLGSVGEPINQEAWEWFHKTVGEGRCDLVDTWWQTETGGVAISPRPSEIGAKIVPGKPMRPMFGINPVLLDEKGKEIEGNDVNGSLCLKTPWPGIAQTVFNNHERFIQTYFTTYPGYFFAGDGAYRDSDGHYQITGRVDDVINVTGHRLGTAEVEDALNNHELAAESAVVGYPHPIKGEGIYAYVVLKEAGSSLSMEEKEKIAKELRSIVKTKISGFAVPEKLQFCSGLPKTRSGKIMRRILKKVAAGEFDDLGDITTLSDPAVVQEVIENHKKMEKEMSK